MLQAKKFSVSAPLLSTSFSQFEEMSVHTCTCAQIAQISMSRDDFFSPLHVLHVHVRCYLPSYTQLSNVNVGLDVTAKGEK